MAGIDRRAQPKSDSFFPQRLLDDGCHVGILARQDTSYKSDVRAAREWLRHYFDTRTRPVQQAGETLEALLAAPMAEDVPDLTSSLDAVRTLKAAQERRAMQPPTPARPNR